MAILLSTKPEWVAKICHEVGKTKDNIPIYEKRIEVRKGKPDKLPCKVYIYCNKSDKNIFNKDWSGKVVGEFICDKVMFLTPLGLRGFEVHPQILNAVCLTKEDLDTYGGLKTIYGWHISDLKIYDKPKELSEFYRPCSYSGICYSCNRFRPNGTPNDKPNDFCDGEITRPPQSYMYVRELCE